MGSIFKVLVSKINNLHDYINQALKLWMPSVTDKDLHFFIIGIMGVFIFIITDYVFKKVSKWSISVISLIYTFTVLVVIVFSIEIEQKITKRGNMEFADIVAGLWGFVVMIGIYLVLRILSRFIYTSVIKHK